jgi:hypothetical protein
MFVYGRCFQASVMFVSLGFIYKYHGPSTNTLAYFPLRHARGRKFYKIDTWAKVLKLFGA